MKKILALFIFFTCAFGSDPISFDSLFKKQIGLRSITSLEYLSSGNADFYNSKPYVSVFNDGKNYLDNKQISLRQTLIYSLTQSFDLLLNAKATYIRSDIEEGGLLRATTYSIEQRANFDSIGVGVIYSFGSLGSFIPQISLNLGAFERVRFDGVIKNFSAKNASAQVSFKTYSDPLILSLYVGFGYNDNLKFNGNSVNFGNAYYGGFDGSIILSPKVSLDIGFQQSYQEASKYNGRQYTGSYSIPTISLGFSYSFDDNTAISLFGTGSGSNSAPSSIFGVSLWKKF